MTDVERVEKTDEEWRKALTPEQYMVLRQAATERPWSGKLLASHGRGTYACAGCGAELFESDTKFESGCGWPSFFRAKHDGAIEYVEDRTHGMVRVETRCGTCGGHLGHVFDDGPPPTGRRYCMNSIALRFTDDDGNVTVG
jgi:peptide-methionine (R)-S-oxide reductase